MDFTSFAWCRVELKHHVAVVELQPTGKINRMGPDFWREMPQLFSHLESLEVVRAIVLTGAGAGFSSGLDLAAMGAELMPLLALESDAAQRKRLFELIVAMQKACSSVAACKKPVIAAVHGYCIGAGVDLIASCDVRFASSDAVFSIREVKLAIVADMGTLARLPAIIGQGATRHLALSGEDFDAAKALKLGLVSEVLPDRPAALERALGYAAQVAKNPPLTVEGIKQVLNLQSEVAAAEANRLVAIWNAAFMPSADLTESMAAFLEKREPKFQGK
jgi:enoyl-CoA hydratase